MLILNPQLVRFDSWSWPDASSISIDRAAAHLIEEWTDLGPHAGFIDVSEIRTTIRLTRKLASTALDDPPLGHLADLAFAVAPHATDARTRAFEISCVLTSIKTDAGGPSPALGTQTFTFHAVSGSGDIDPIRTSE